MARERKLEVVFSGDAAQLEKATDAAVKSTESMGKKMAAVFGGLQLDKAVEAVDALVNKFAAVEVSNDKLAAQLGLAPEEAAEFGKISGKVYANNFGDSVEQVNAALKEVTQRRLVPEDADAAELQKITEKALALSSAFDQDVAGVTNAVQQMLRTGLAGSAEEAFDLLTRGFQQGLDRSGDLLDTLNEYGTQFRKLGLDGAGAMNLIQQGLKGGARDADIVADALKEFSIRAVDGSKATAEGFADLGLNAAQMVVSLGKGGPEATAALDQVLERLRGVKDPVKQAQIAVALFGTQAEDLGQALFGLDPTPVVNMLGKTEGAADKLAQTMGDNTTSKMETFRRKFEMAFAGVGGKVAPLLEVGPGLAGVLAVSDKIGPAFGHVGKAAKGLGGAFSAMGSTLMANPMFLVIAGIVALGVALVIAYQRSETFRNIVNAVFGAIADAGKWMWETVLKPVFEAWMGYVRLVADVVGWLWEHVIKPVFALIAGWVKMQVSIFSWVYDHIIRPAFELWAKGIDWVVDRVKGIAGFVKDAFVAAANFARGPINVIIGLINGVLGGIEAVARGVGKIPGTPDFLDRLSLPRIPELGDGALIRGSSKGTLALLGERGPGHDEAVVPLGRGGTAAMGGPIVNMYITVQGSVVTERDLVTSVGQELERKFGRGGYLTDLRGRTLRPT